MIEHNTLSQSSFAFQHRHTQTMNLVRLCFYVQSVGMSLHSQYLLRRCNFTLNSQCVERLQVFEGTLGAPEATTMSESKWGFTSGFETGLTPPLDSFTPATYGLLPSFVDNMRLPKSISVMLIVVPSCDKASLCSTWSAACSNATITDAWRRSAGRSVVATVNWRCATSTSVCTRGSR